jgi:hypothetical protein
MNTHLGTTALVFVALTVTGPAMADSTWFCSVGLQNAPSIQKYQVLGSEMIQVPSLEEKDFEKRLGISSEPRKFQVLKDTPEGIVAAYTVAESSISVYANVILINKKTGVMRKVSISAKNPDDSASVYGSCVPG